MATSNLGASQGLLSVAAALPLVMCMRDCFYSLCKVKGSSMEPSLKNGDILLIRKADFPILNWLSPEKDATKDTIFDVDESAPITRSRRLREYEYQHHLAREGSSVLVRRAWPMRGQIVTYRSPYQYPPELCIKRVVGVEGQVVKTTIGLKDVDMNCVWVEGDNHENSSDSRNHGAVNQKLVVGVAEYILWPPSRMGKIEKKVDDEKSYWP